MDYNIDLPVVSPHGYYEIRLESIGGLGANVCGKILGELGALYLNLNSASFSSYGSEKKGSPVKSYIRYSHIEHEIRINSPIESPHLLGLFHDRLKGSDVMAGVSVHTNVVINTPLSHDSTRDKLQMHAGTLFVIDALNIALECKTRVNMVMLGAIARAAGFIPLDALNDIVRDTLGKKYPQALQGNLDGIKRGFNEVTAKTYEPNDTYPYQQYKEIERDWGYKNAPIGGVIPIWGSTVSNDLSAIREGYIPVFIKDKCINCGLCDTTCPDCVYQFVEGEYRGKRAMVNIGPDYHHCKGCLRCVEVCPTGAIIEGPERDYDLPAMHIRNQDLVIASMKFEEIGQSGLIESESAVINELPN